MTQQELDNYTIEQVKLFFKNNMDYINITKIDDYFHIFLAIPITVTQYYKNDIDAILVYPSYINILYTPNSLLCIEQIEEEDTNVHMAMLYKYIKEKVEMFISLKKVLTPTSMFQQINHDIIQDFDVDDIINSLHHFTENLDGSEKKDIVLQDIDNFFCKNTLKIDSVTLLKIQVCAYSDIDKLKENEIFSIIISDTGIKILFANKNTNNQSPISLLSITKTDKQYKPILKKFLEKYLEILNKELEL